MWKIGILAFLDQQMSHFLKIQTVNFTDLIMPASRYIFWKFLLNFYIFRLKKNQGKEFWAQKWPKFKCLSLGIILEKATNWFRGGGKSWFWGQKFTHWPHFGHNKSFPGHSEILNFTYSSMLVISLRDLEKSSKKLTLGPKIPYLPHLGHKKNFPYKSSTVTFNHSFKVMQEIFSLFRFLSLKESTLKTRKNIF